jgi:hypothetical protein
MDKSNNLDSSMDDPKITPEELEETEQNIRDQDISFCLGQYNYLTYGKR